MIAHEGHNLGPAQAEALGMPADAAPRAGSTILRLVVGGQLRKHRITAGLTLEQAGFAIRGSHSKISRMESGRTGFKNRDVEDLLTLYRVTDESVRAQLLDLAVQASGPDWWHPYSDVLPRWLEPYVGLEAAAEVIRSYEVQFVHGLLQTDAYARAVIRSANPHADALEIERRAKLRLERQKVLTLPSPPRLWAVLDEGALRRRPEGPDGRAVMRGQVEHLLEFARLPAVTLQIFPCPGPIVPTGGPFTMLRFPYPDVPDVVYLEQFNSALYVDDPVEVVGYLTQMDRLVKLAAQPDDSIRILDDLLRDLRREP
jgi:transcriptional regulator with XRE-family HTH domain